MKFLAILRDSIREAIDTKVFYMTLGLSAFLLILVASVSFRPISVEEQAEQTAKLFNFASGFGPRAGSSPNFQIENFQKTGPDAEPWKGAYHFDFVARLPEGAEPAKDDDMLAKAQFKRVLKDTFYRHETVEVEPADRSDPRAVRYPIRIEGTKIDDIRDWVYEPTIFFAIPLPMPFFATSLSGAVYWIEDRLVNRYGAWVGILAGIVITAFFIPNMLRKGTIDLLLAKPVRRWSLLLYKYVGGLAFVFLNTAFVVGGLWLVLGLRSGIWAPGFLVSIFAVTFFFAILYSVSAFFAVLTRSPIVSILMTVVVWFFLTVVGLAHQFIDSQREFEKKPEAVLIEPISTKWWAKTIDAVHFILPRPNDMDVLTTQFISHSLLTEAERKARNINESVSLSWGESLTVSAVFVALLLGLSCWRFTVRDY